MQPYLFAACGEDARSLARALLLHALEAARGISVLPVIARTDSGKPYFPDHPDLHFSYSHTRGFALCALWDRPIGADIETRRVTRTDLPQRILAPGELADYRRAADPPGRLLTYWTLRESYWKQVGTGMVMPLFAPEFYLRPGGRADCVVPGVTGRYYAGSAHAGWHAAICTLGDEETTLPAAPLWIML